MRFTINTEYFMKIEKLLLNVLFTLMLMGTHTTFSQESVHASGGEASGNGGLVSYSVGQLVYTLVSDNGGSLAQGVQQAYEILAVGVSETENNMTLSIYPNPTADVLNLLVADLKNEVYTYQLIDNQGRVVKTGSVINQQTQLSISALTGNVFFLNVLNSNNNQVKSFKIIKK
jgi:hypothetical protein